MLDAVLVLAALGGVVGQAVPGQPRDAAPVVRTDSASIQGHVVNAATGAPIRGAVVSLVPADRPSVPSWTLLASDRRPPPPRAVPTDERGAFQFQMVAAGAYRLVASTGVHYGRYLPSGLSAGRPHEAGRALQAAPGQAIAGITVALTIASAIEGRVVDDAGEPVARVAVSAARLMLGSRIPQRVAVPPVTTDDLGRFRVFGLEAGTYVVLAEPSSVPMVASGMEGDPLFFSRTFHPASPTESAAQRVIVPPSGDVLGIDIQLARVRRFTVSGTVMDSHGQPLSNVNAVLTRPTFGGAASQPASVDGSGRFAVKDVEYGDYRLRVRGTRHLPGAAPRVEFADVPLAVAGDVADLIVGTQPGATIAGRLIVDDGVPLPQGAAPSVHVHGFPGAKPESEFESSAKVDGDLRFTIPDAAGRKLLRPSSLPPGWSVIAVTYEGQDVTDVPTEFRSQAEVRVHVTSRGATLDGRVQVPSGEPPVEAVVYVFPEDRRAWTVSSPRVRRVDVRPGEPFEVAGLAAGAYRVVAVARDGFRIPAGAGEEFFEVLSETARSVGINQGERHTTVLPLWRWPE